MIDRAYVGWFERCDLCLKWRLRVFWWEGADTSCKRCRKRYGWWDEMRAALRTQGPDTREDVAS